MEPCLSNINVIVQIIQAVISIFAIIVAGIWGYWLFIKTREKYPRAIISHHITHKNLTENKVLLHVVIVISNPGNVLLSLISLETRIQQMIPPPIKLIESIDQGLDPVQKGETEINWPMIDSLEMIMEKGDYEIEPKEIQEIQFDFILNTDVESVVVYSYLKNEMKRGREIGWDKTTIYNLNIKDEI